MPAELVVHVISEQVKFSRDRHVVFEMMSFGSVAAIRVICRCLELSVLDVFVAGAIVRPFVSE